MRISAKQLRYAIELFAQCWGKKIESFGGQIAEMQEALGKVHDCDVWIESLGEHLQDDENNQIQTSIWLLSKFSKKRTENYRDALRIWSKWQTADFEKSMRAIVDSAD